MKNLSRECVSETENKLQWRAVYPESPGVVKTRKGYVFTACIEAEKEVSLLFYKKGESRPEIAVPLSKEKSFGDYRAVMISGISMDEYEYNYCVDGEVQQDFYAHSLSGVSEFGKEYPKGEHAVRCRYQKENYYWKNEKFSPILLSDSILYKLQVRSFTKDKDSGVREKGTFRGVEQKIAYLKKLGITGVLFMPAYEYRECSKEVKEPEHFGERKKKVRVNCWGYTGEANYFAPKASFCSTDYPYQEFCKMVDSLHGAGIECLMEFYFDGSVGSSQILDILHYWMKTYHIDGFHLMGKGVLPEVLVKDKWLSQSKLFFSDINGEQIYQKQIPSFRHIAEYNEGFLYCMRHLLKSDEGMIEEFLYRNKRNYKNSGVINYMADQDGLTMMDMVSYDERHNEANGENGRDGIEYNCSWNCGAEGYSRKKSIRRLRMGQLKNAFLMLLLSQGTPLIFQGDEFGNSQGGNNNAWCQDNETGWVNWKKLRQNKELFEFVQETVSIRKMHSILHLESELKGADYKAVGYPDISYHSNQPWYYSGSPQYRHIGILYCEEYAGCEKELLFAAYNFHWNEHEFGLPSLSEKMSWEQILTSGEDAEIETEILKEEKTEKNKKKKEIQRKKVTIKVGPRTVVILKGKQDEN